MISAPVVEDVPQSPSFVGEKDFAATVGADTEREGAAEAFPPGSSFDDDGSARSVGADSKRDVTVADAVVTAPPAATSEFPDGGFRAWLVVFGGMCTAFATFGIVNTWGEFQAYYQKTLLRDSSPSNIAWIGSIQYSFIFIPGLLVGRLFDLGYFRATFFVSSILLVAATALVAQCTQYWHFLLCQGFMTGIACSGIFSPAAPLITHWFKQRRGMAMGLVTVGGSIGGTVVPIAVRNLIEKVGFQWTMRIIAFILTMILGLANLTVKRRIPATGVTSSLFDLRVFKSAPYIVYCLSGFFVFLGLYTVLTFIDVSAASYGISENYSFYLLAIANASSGFGRYFAGWLSDRLGPMNVTIPLTAIAGVFTFAWPFARTAAPITIVAVFYGFASGAYVSLVSNPLMEMGRAADIGRRNGMCLSILALGALCGPPISGAINRATGGFTAVGYFAGSTIVAGVALIFLSRQLVLGRLWGTL